MDQTIIFLARHIRRYRDSPAVDAEDSAGTLDAIANNVAKYIAQITLSAASPAVTTDDDVSRNSDMAT